MKIERKSKLLALLVSALIISTMLASCAEKNTETATVLKPVAEQSVTSKPIEPVEPTKAPTSTPNPTEVATPTPKDEPSATPTPKTEVTTPTVTQKPTEATKPSQEPTKKPVEPTKKPTQPTEKPAQPVKEEPKPTPAPTTPPSNNEQTNPPTVVKNTLKDIGKQIRIEVNYGTITSHSYRYKSPGANVDITIDSSKRWLLLYTEKTCYIEVKLEVAGDDGKQYTLYTNVIFVGADAGSYHQNSIRSALFTVYLGTQAQLDTEGVPSKWTSSDESIATVDQNGLVTAVGTGKAYITAYFDTGTSTCIVTVP